MLASPNLDQAHLLMADRLAEAQHHALVHLATSTAQRPAGFVRGRPLRLRVATVLRGLACRLDPSVALNA
jgi:hypothetical protein